MPTLAPTITPTATPSTLAGQLDLAQVVAEAVPLVDLYITTQGKEDFVVIPSGKLDYVWGLTHIPDGSLLVAAGKEIKAVYVSPLKQEAYFSLPRGTKAVQLKMADGSQVELSAKLPAQEPEDKFMDAQPKMGFTFKGIDTKVREWGYFSEVGYRESQRDSVHWLPKAESGFIYLDLTLSTTNKNLSNTIKKDENGIRLIDVQDTTKQYLPLVIPYGWGSNLGNYSVFYKIPASKNNAFYIYFRDTGILSFSSASGGLP